MPAHSRVAAPLSPSVFQAEQSPAIRRERQSACGVRAEVESVHLTHHELRHLSDTSIASVTESMFRLAVLCSVI